MKANLIAITGNTFPVKDQLKALGGRWNAERKAWMVPAAKADQARALVGRAPSRTYNPHRIAERRADNECEMCGKNKYTCGHCIGW